MVFWIKSGERDMKGVRGKKKNSDNFHGIWLMIMFTIMGVAIIAIPLFFSGNNDSKKIEMNVTGIVNATESSVVVIQYECIKMCVEEMSDGTYGQDKCFEQCENLGGG